VQYLEVLVQDTEVRLTVRGFGCFQDELKWLAGRGGSRVYAGQYLGPGYTSTGQQTTGQQQGE
jgi:hypothetical protein